MARLVVRDARITIDGLTHPWHIDAPVDADSATIMAAMNEARRVEAAMAQIGSAGARFNNTEIRTDNERVNGRVILPDSVALVIIHEIISKGSVVVIKPLVSLDPNDPERSVINGWAIDITQGVEGRVFGPPINISVAYRPDISIGRAHLRQDWAEHLAGLIEKGEDVRIEPAYIKHADGSIQITEFSVVPGPRVLSRRSDDKAE